MAEAGKHRAWLRLLLGYGLAIATVCFTFRLLGNGFEQLAQLPTTASLPALASSLILMLLHTLCNREAFLQLCRSMDSGVPDNSLRLLWGRSLLAKYVPGGIWQLVGRAMLLRQLNARHNSAYYSGLVEQAISLGLCLSIAAIASLLLSHPALATFAVAAIALAATIACRLLPGIASRHHLCRALLLYCLAMPFYLAAYACIATSLPLVELAARLFAGTSAGMLAFIVPGGLGVRESVASLLGSGQATSLLAAMLIVRLITVCLEICLCLLAWIKARST